jgi:hypothetical protein
MKNHKILDIDGVAFFMKLFVDITTFQNRSILQICLSIPALLKCQIYSRYHNRISATCCSGVVCLLVSFLTAEC